MRTGPVLPLDRAAPSVDAPAPDSWWARREDVRLLTGDATYVGDVDREDQLHLRVVRNVVPHGRLLGIDTAAAAALPGVLRVLTAADLDPVPRIPLRNRTRPELDSFLQPVLAVDRVRYVGEPVAVVVATSAALAEDAAELVDVEVEPLPAVVDVDAPQPVPVWEHAPSGTMCRFIGRNGDVDRALAHADVVVVTQEFSTGRDTGLPLETRGLVAEWAEDGTLLHLWGPTKFVRFTRQTVASWFGLEPDRVVCHHVDVGGMFGTRGEVYPEDFLVPWAASVVGAPVKWIEDTNEHLLAINHSRSQTHRVTAAARTCGELVALRVDSVVDLGAYARPIGGRPAESVIESLPGPYRWGTVDLTSRAASTNKTPAGNMRAPSAFDTAFARERVLDMLAAELGRDPVDLRRQNLISAAELPFTRSFDAVPSEPGALPPVHDSVYDSGNYPDSLERLLEHVSFPGLQAQLRRRRDAGELVGFGLGCFLGHSGTGREETIRLDLTASGRFRFVTLGSEIGQGLASLVATVGAEALGVPADDIDVVTNDTTDYGEGTGTFGSRSAVFVGSAVVDAAVQLREAVAEQLADGSPDWGRAAPRTVVGHHASTAPTYGFGAHFAVVSVDPDTADVHVERLVVVYDCGRAIDLDSVKGQLVGASIQALGGTLFQELVFDAGGQPQSTTLVDFHVPTLADSPAVEAIVLELPGTTSNPLGVKGAGEAGSMGVGGAVANAVSAALAAPSAVTRLPLRPDDLLPFLPSGVGPPAGAGAARSVPARPPRRQAVPAIGSVLLLGAVTGFGILRRVRGRHD